MKVAEILEQFIFDNTEKARGLDLSGDAKRFFKIKTARAWTAWLAKARG